MLNPTLKESFIKSSFNSLENEHAMSMGGTTLKTIILGLFTMCTFAYTWYLQLAGFADKASLLYYVGIFGGLILCFAICFMPKNKFLIITTPLYALCEGLALGYISVLANKFYPGIVAQATVGTFFTVFGMFFLYSMKIIKCTDKFRAVVYNSVFAIFGIYLLQFILNFFHIQIPGLFSNGIVGIVFSLVVITIAAFRLIIDFSDIERYSGNLDKNYEWYFGFSLMVTIIWLYIEILNLLMKFASRNNQVYIYFN